MVGRSTKVNDPWTIKRSIRLGMLMTNWKATTPQSTRAARSDDGVNARGRITALIFLGLFTKGELIFHQLTLACDEN